LGELWVAAGPNGAGTRCVGLAPLGDGSLNVTCVWSDGDRGPAGRARWASIVETFPEVARRLRGYALESRVMASGPFDRPVRRVAWPGALLVGDAAGYYDPFTGEGIYRALRSAELAEPYALEFLATGSVTALTEYDRAIRSDLRWGRWLEGVVERIVHRPMAFRAAAAILSRYPALAGALLRRVGDAPWAPR
jgi:flavin-dependent dehydrogenase